MFVFKAKVEVGMDKTTDRLFHAFLLCGGVGILIITVAGAIMMFKCGCP